MKIQELKKNSPAQLIEQAEKLGIENASTLRKQEILFGSYFDGLSFLSWIVFKSI